MPCPKPGFTERQITPPWLDGCGISLSVNRNKRSLAVDLKTEEGRCAVRRMADRVVVRATPSRLATDHSEARPIDLPHARPESKILWVSPECAPNCQKRGSGSALHS
ncbi:CoA transferase [Amycolatopsis sp. GM8]|uniref:CoA transferase n=1 Tax=Amycolatopsis sp. GM8 TaxID=2896530 RepID=UPI0035ABCC57